MNGEPIRWYRGVASATPRSFVDFEARYADGTRRRPISPLIDTYLVSDTALQGARSARYRPRAHHRPQATDRGDVAG
eukprot:5299333-Prymnesium_polylepis.1